MIKMEKSTQIKKIRRIILDRCAVLSYLDEFEDHFMTLKHAPHHIINIRHISIKTSPNTIQDTEGHAPHKIQVTPNLKTVYKYSRIY